LPPVTRQDFWFVLLYSGVIGFYLAILREEWSAALETAQVLAGVVRYPEHNTFYIYHKSVFTAIHQVLALFLWAGVPERVLNFLFAGFCGAFSFAAYSLWTLALCRDRYLALSSPLLMVPDLLMPGAVRFPFDLGYPAALLPGSHWPYAMFSTSWGALTLAL